MQTITLNIIFIITVTTSFAQVGIGTVLPEAALDVSSSTSGFLAPRVSLTSTTVAAPVVNPQGGGNLITGTIVFNTNTAGNVTPGLYRWDAATTAWIPIEKDNLGNHTATEELKMGANVVDFGDVVGEKIDYYGGLYRVDIESAELKTIADNTAMHTWYDGTTENMRLDGNGNLGIGTTPGQKLDIVGDGANIRLYNNNATNFGTSLLMLDNHWSGAIHMNSGDLFFRTGGISAAEDRMFIKNGTGANAGYVGIGTNAPSVRLDARASGGVNGAIGLGETTQTAPGAGAGTLRYSTGSGGIIQYSNGIVWNTLTSTVQKSIVVASKSFTTQTITNFNLGVINTWVEEVDNNSTYNPATGIFTAPRNGVYSISGTLGFIVANNYQGWVETVILINTGGVVKSFKSSSPAVSGANNVQITPGSSINITIPLALGDTVSLGAYNSTDRVLNIRANLGGDVPSEGFNSFSIVEH